MHLHNLLPAAWKIKLVSCLDLEISQESYPAQNIGVIVLL